MTKTDPYLASLNRLEVSATLDALRDTGPTSMLHQLIWEPALLGNLIVLHVAVFGVGRTVTYALDNRLQALYNTDDEMREVLVRFVMRQFEAQLQPNSTLNMQAVTALMQHLGFAYDGEGWTRDGARWVFPLDAEGVGVCHLPRLAASAFSVNFSGAPDLESHILLSKDDAGHYIHPGIGN